MSAESRALRFAQLSTDDAAWRLLRSDLAPVIAGILTEHLTGEQTRLDAAELHERIDSDLDELRARGFDLPQSAQGYLSAWRHAGFVLRRPTEESRGETFELTSAGLAALRFLEGRAAPRQSLTESRLASLSTQLRQLAIDSDPQSHRRIERLRADRDRIDEQIEAIQTGVDEPLAGERAIERVRDILAQAAEVPDDFARVRAEFEQLNSTLRAQIIESVESQRIVLDEIFRGVDVIAESDAGRSFSGFTGLLLDPALGSEFENDIAQVLDRDFVDQLSTTDRRELRQFFSTMKDRSAEIQDVITLFARGLRRYVQSQDYQRDRVLRSELLNAMNHARDTAAVIRPWSHLGVDLDLTAVALSSIGSISFHDPSEFDASAPIVEHDTGVADLDTLRAAARQTEIDFDELRSSVNSVISAQESATVGEVLERFPATQGVASIVGLLSLAADFGVVEAETEVLGWTATDGHDRRARVTRHRFMGRVE